MTAVTSAPSNLDVSGRVRRRFVVTGVVQGVGFRPFVYLSATELGLTGSVSNSAAGVLIEVEGALADVAEFAHHLETKPPTLARVDHVDALDLPIAGGEGFSIIESSASGDGRTLAPPDVATCPECLAELADPRNRRYRHPFITCTNCGPRFTIIRDLPYDRPATTMAGFAMCPACETEYRDPADRRFHAQTIACPECGPVLALARPGRERVSGNDAIDEARRVLAEGAILAVKGIGGYHVMCDATNDVAVTELRRRKRRGDKPFAVMVRDLSVAHRLAAVGPEHAALLRTASRPIVLVPKASGPSEIAPSVAPRVPDLGIMVAYTPLHALLFGLDGDSLGPDAFVATSGNLSGEPIVADDTEAFERLGSIVDGWLVHDRPIEIPCDDSVVTVVDGEALPIRRARGYAPMPVSLPYAVPPTLAVGADLKNTCCLASGNRGWVSQHIGDMDDLATLAAFERTEASMESLTAVAPDRYAIDGHPGFRSSAWGRRRAGDRPVVAVQHHHAHVAALMGEHAVAPDTPVIGIVFDGTGYGTDGAIWGGETLIATYADFARFAHLRYVPLPGGNAAVERPYRMALAYLSQAGIEWDRRLASVAACPSDEAGALRHQLETGLGCVPTSSMGRLFDAVASLCGIRQRVEYEAQAAIELEGLARVATDALWRDDGYVFDLRAAGPGGGAVEIDAAPVIRAVVDDVLHGARAKEVAVRFHGAVIALVARVAELARESSGLATVGLTGGVFQNAVVASGSSQALRDHGFTVLQHRFVPPNDGGVALGQVLVSAARASRNGDLSCA